MAEGTSDQLVQIELTAVQVQQQHTATDERRSRYEQIDEPKTRTDEMLVGVAAPIQPMYNHGNQQQVWHTTSAGQSATSGGPGEGSSSKGSGRKLAEDRPFEMICTECNKLITTKVNHEAGTCSLASCIAFSVFGCICGCCLLPFVMPYFMDAVHTCPNCGSLIGKRKKL